MVNYKKIGIAIIATIVLNYTAYGQAQVEEIQSERIHLSIDSKLKSKIQFSNPSRAYPNQIIKPWKLYQLCGRMSSDLQKTKSIFVGCDDLGKLWTVHTDKDAFLYDYDSGNVLFRFGKPTQLTVTPNGKFLVVDEPIKGTGDEEAEDIEGESSIYRISGMQKLTVNPVVVYGIIGNGRYVIIRRKNGPKEIVDLENALSTVKVIGKGEIWGQAGVFESGDGQLLLKENKDGMNLYSLPSFEIVKSYPEIGPGAPFINGTGTVIASNRGRICYFVNRDTGEVKGYGINRQTCNELIEGAPVKIGKGESRYEDVVTKEISLTDLKTTRTFNELDQNTSLLNASLKNPNCGVAQVLCPSGTGILLMVINRANTWQKLDDNSGDSFVLEVGEDLGIKKIFHYSRLLINPTWDEETKSIVYQSKGDEYVRIPVTF